MGEIIAVMAQHVAAPSAANSYIRMVAANVTETSCEVGGKNFNFAHEFAPKNGRSTPQRTLAFCAKINPQLLELCHEIFPAFA
jgi:hypothetical protein